MRAVAFGCSKRLVVAGKMRRRKANGREAREEGEGEREERGRREGWRDASNASGERKG